MNVLTIIHYPIFGGPHNRVSIVAKLLKPQGVKTTVLLPVGSDAAAQRMAEHGVEAVTMPLHRLRSIPDPRLQVAWLRDMRREVTAITELITERGIDVVAINALANPHGAFAARRAGVACVWEIIDTFPPALMRRAYMPLVLRYSDVVMTTGRRVAEVHPGTTKLGERWITFFPSVDVERFRSDAATRHRARAELGLPANATVVGNVATLNPMKGHCHFIRAAAQLRTTHPHVRFVILGSSDPRRQPYYRRLWNEAEALGLRLGADLIVRDPRGRVAELAQAFDLFWMTSEPRSEGIPTAIGEAQALGLPVVTTDVGSTAECVRDDVSGFVTPPRDTRAIADATRRILDDPALMTSMRAAARRDAEVNYAAERGAEQHLLAYEKAIAHRALILRASGGRLSRRRTNA